MKQLPQTMSAQLKISGQDSTTCRNGHGMTDTRGRQTCRNEFRANTPAIYVDKFGNDYRSELGKQTAQDMELLAMEMQSSECPTVDFKWRTKMPEPTVLPWEESEDETWLEP